MVEKSVAVSTPVPALRRSTRKSRQPVRFAPGDYGSGHSHQVSMEVDGNQQAQPDFLDKLITLASIVKQQQ